MFMLALFATMYSVQNVNDINLNVVISIFVKVNYFMCIDLSDLSYYNTTNRSVVVLCTQGRI